jgi:uncharacterized protein HemY
MRRKPVVTFVVAMVVMVMVLFGIERAGRSAGPLGLHVRMWKTR